MRDIGKNIKDLRTQKGLTQDALAASLFVTRQTVSNYETGKSRPDIDMLLRIAETLEVDIHAILYGSQPRDRRELIRLAISGGITLVLGIILLTTGDWTKRIYYNLWTSPYFLHQTLVQPLFFALLGWTAIQGVSALPDARLPTFSAAKSLRRLLLGLAILWLVMTMPMGILVLIEDLLRLHTGDYTPLYHPRFIHHLGFYALDWSIRLPWFPLLLGVGLRLCGSSKAGRRETDTK